MICRNPILPGFHPDPSVCRVGRDFYLVNSTFAYFPGVPVFHSRNLADWEQIGNVLERSSQVPLAGCGHSEGIFAPTIRYFRGVYYMITTNVSGGGNFIVTAEDPAGPWSEPYFLGEDAQGIDPSLFFDDDGTCYYIGQRANSQGSCYYGDCEIWIQRLNLNTMRLEGEATAVLTGFQKNAVWAEGPHLYKKDGYYYILHAESGTAQQHCVVAARSRAVTGPYEYCPHNPILTHRHLGSRAAVTCVGHGDLVDDGSGNWYMVMLGCRPEKGRTLMGRETFLARVEWEDGWPVVNPGVGMLEETFELPDEIGAAEPDAPEKKQRGKELRCSAVTGLPLSFLMLRNPESRIISFDPDTGRVRLCMTKATLKDLAAPAYVGVRQCHRAYCAEAAVLPCFDAPDDCAGLAIVQSNENHIRMEVRQSSIRLILCCGGRDTVLAESEIYEPEGAGPKETRIFGPKGGAEVSRLKLALRIKVCGLRASFSWNRDGEWKILADSVLLEELSTEAAGGFVGCTVGMYVSSNGEKSEGYADFAGFSYITGESSGFPVI